MDFKAVLRDLSVALMAGSRPAWATLLLSVVVAGALVNPFAARCGLRKASLYGVGALHMLFSRDRKFRKPRPNPDDVLSCPKESIKTVQVVFLRHGESEWNNVFNKGFGPSFPFRLVRAVVKEALCFFTDDSEFIDSPLSHLGCAQASALATFLAQPRTEEHGLSKAEAAAHALVRATPGSGVGHSVLCTSTLRRAAATVAISCGERLRRTGETVYALSDLQEMSPNVDTLALAGKGETPPLREKQASAMKCSGSYNAGNKRVRGTGDVRLAGFAEWCFSGGHGAPGVIAAGHSLWFRAFIDTYLPKDVTHEARKKKVRNCAVLAFSLQRGVNAAGKPVFRIVPDSLAMVYGGYH